MWTIWVSLLVLCGSAYTWITVDDCVTRDGNVGRCTNLADCPTSHTFIRSTQCRYSRGYSMQICCLPSPLSGHFSYYPADKREDYSNDPSIAFPSESSFSESYPYNHQASSNNNNPLFFKDPNYSPYNSRPVYNERPTYTTGDSDYYPYRPRPSHNNNPHFSSENSDYQPYRPRPSQSRPDYNENPSYATESSYGYNERPKPSYGFDNDPQPSNSGQGRPNSYRPVSSWGSSEDDSRYQPGKQTAPRPIWSVDNSPKQPSKAKRSISQRKCEEYSKSVSEAAVLPLSIDTEAVPQRIQTCKFSAVELIVGGEAAELGEFPHMAALGFQSASSRDIVWNCGGTLISDRYVMTAGHCVNTTFGNPVIVRLGEYNLVNDNDGADPEDFRIEKIIPHPNYFKSLKYNDIALIKLNRAVRFNKFIRPACLPSDDSISGMPTATGWGRTDFVGRLSDILMKVNLNIINNKLCNSFYSTNSPSSSSFSSGIIDTMLCAGVLEGKRDTCLGDSGGPLSITKKDNPCIHYVVGITSFGKICGAPNSPGVYTKVSKYLTWIERTVWPNET